MCYLILNSSFRVPAHTPRLYINLEKGATIVSIVVIVFKALFIFVIEILLYIIKVK